MDHNLVAESQWMVLAERLAAKQDAFQAPVVVAQTKIDVSGR
jgi:hypothetical protein